MRGFHAGIIAGTVGHAVFFSYIFLRAMIGQPSLTVPYAFSYDFWINYFIYHVGIGAIVGGLFGILYSRFYDGVPSKGVKKGLVFGLIIGLLSNISYGTRHLLVGLLAGSEQNLIWAWTWSVAGLLIWIAYGIVLGLLYERWK